MPGRRSWHSWPTPATGRNWPAPPPAWDSPERQAEIDEVKNYERDAYPATELFFWPQDPAGRPIPDSGPFSSNQVVFYYAPVLHLVWTPELSQKIAGLYHDHPGRAPQLLDALDRVALERINADRVRDGILVIAYLFEHHAADLKDEISVRALKTVERFASVDGLVAAIERARKAHGGTSS